MTDYSISEVKISSFIRKDDLRLAKRIVNKDPERYANLSHYIRCAIIKLNRDEKERLRV